MLTSQDFSTPLLSPSSTMSFSLVFLSLPVDSPPLDFMLDDVNLSFHHPP